MKTPNYPEAKELASMFFPISNAFLRLMHNCDIVPSGLTSQQMKIIMELNVSGTLRLKDLSRCAAVTHGTMAVAVQKLHKRGLLIKAKDPHDERAVSLMLTDKGRAMAKQMQEVMVDMFNLICRGISASDRKRLLDNYRFLLRTYQKVLEQKGC